jgi:hypothetical protein
MIEFLDLTSGFSRQQRSCAADARRNGNGNPGAALQNEQRSPSIAVQRFAASGEPPHATVDAPSVATDWSAIDLDDQRASNNDVVRFGGDNGCACRIPIIGFASSRRPQRRFWLEGPSRHGRKLRKSRNRADHRSSRFGDQ